MERLVLRVSLIWASRITSLVICLAMLAVSTAAQRIVDLSGNGVAGVEVEATGLCVPTVGPLIPGKATSISDANGMFEWLKPSPSASGSWCQLTKFYTYTLKKEGYVFTRDAFSWRPEPGVPVLYPPFDNRLNLIEATDVASWVNVSAASFALNAQYLAAEMIVAGFGSNLATTTESASLPLPTELAGRKVLVRDAKGIERAAQLLFVSPGQINYLMPSGLAEGPAVIRLVDTAGALMRGWLAQIRPAVPGIFTANATGEGVPAAVVVRVKPGETPAYEPVARFDEALRRFVSLQLDLGPESEFLVLALFGTGWRNLSSFKVVAHNSRITIECPIEYIGKQPTLAGLDQLNVRLSRALIGVGEVTIVISRTDNLPGDIWNGASNAVVLNFK